MHENDVTVWPHRRLKKRVVKNGFGLMGVALS
jgi:hypothetical protein